MYDGTKRVSTLSSGVIGSVVKKGFSLYPFTLNSALFLGSTISTAPFEKNGAHDEWSRPTSLQLPRENMKPRVIQQNLISQGKVLKTPRGGVNRCKC